MLIFFKGSFSGAYLWRGLSTEGNLRFKIDWASLIVGKKLTVFALFYFVFEGNLQVQAPRGGLYFEGRFNGGFFALRVWGPYTWRGLFSEFYGIIWFVKTSMITIATSPQASSTLITNSLGVLSLYRRCNLDFCVEMIFNRNGRRYHYNLIENRNTPFA